MAVRLTADQVKGLAKPGRYGDGGGLYLSIAPGGSKSWIQRVTLDGKRTDKGLGGWPTVSLAKARKLADANRVAIRRSVNPFNRESRPIILAQAAPGDMPSFREAARKVHENKVDGLASTTARRWLRRLEIHLFARLGDTPVDEISRADLADALAPIKRRNFESFRKVKQSVTETFTWATAMGFIDHSPADAALDVLLPKVNQQVEHREALHYSEVGQAIQKIRNSEGKRAARLAYEFLILTAARSGEVRFATWQEIDMESGTWTIPASRMKSRHAQVVPLSGQAKAILGQARFFNLDEDGWPVQLPPEALIFPHPTTKQRLSENIFIDRARKSNLNCDTHGFRSSFRDWATETTAGSYEAIELCLAHRVGTAVTQAYFRSNLLDQRREIMQRWADYIAPDLSPF